MQFSSNPSSKWLDRLRRSKGFPANSDKDLDHFLSHQNTPSHNPKTPQTTITNPNPAKQGLTSVLFDLFNFGESNEDPLLISKKGIRKQKNPRFCVVSKNGDDVAVTRLTREENGEICDFVGFSRTNVTVIDTSYPWWKCERVVFRKKSLWRVRDRKGKSANIVGKKRRPKTPDDEKYGPRKKLKMFGSSSEDGNKQNERINTNIEESDDTLSQVQNQRFPRKSKKGGTSDGVLIKKTLTSKNGIISLKTDES